MNVYPRMYFNQADYVSRALKFEFSGGLIVGESELLSNLSKNKSLIQFNKELPSIIANSQNITPIAPTTIDPISNIPSVSINIIDDVVFLNFYKEFPVNELLNFVQNNFQIVYGIYQCHLPQVDYRKFIDKYNKFNLIDLTELLRSSRYYGTKTSRKTKITNRDVSATIKNFYPKFYDEGITDLRSGRIKLNKDLLSCLIDNYPYLPWYKICFDLI